MNSIDNATAPIIEASGLVKRFGKVEALAGLDLVAPSGQVVAVLGPNGAGKTTFVRTLSTLTAPDAGTLRVAGIDAVRHPERVRRVIGLAGQFAAVEESMTGRENVQMIARLYGQSRRLARRNPIFGPGEGNDAPVDRRRGVDEGEIQSGLLRGGRRCPPLACQRTAAAKSRLIHRPGHEIPPAGGGRVRCRGAVVRGRLSLR